MASSLRDGQTYSQGSQRLLCGVEPSDTRRIDVKTPGLAIHSRSKREGIDIAT